MSCLNKIILIQLLVGAVMCDDTHLIHYRSPQNAESNEVNHQNTSSEIAENANITSNKVNITVYYESLCPGSIDFITTELKTVVEKLSSYVNVHLVPYGHAQTHKTREHYSFSCQHGRAECNGNKLQACTLDVLKNRTEAVLFNACLLRKHPRRPKGSHKADFISSLNWCGHEQNVLINDIWDCLDSDRSSILLDKYGKETQELGPDYVPYVVVDGSVVSEDLLPAVCAKLNPVPSVCSSDSDSEEDW